MRTKRNEDDAQAGSLTAWGSALAAPRLQLARDAHQVARARVRGARALCTARPRPAKRLSMRFVNLVFRQNATVRSLDSRPNTVYIAHPRTGVRRRRDREQTQCCWHCADPVTCCSSQPPPPPTSGTDVAPPIVVVLHLRGPTPPPLPRRGALIAPNSGLTEPHSSPRAVRCRCAHRSSHGSNR